MAPSSIHRELLSNDQRIDLPAKLFGAVAFPFKVEPAIFNMAGMLATEYRGGFWDMYGLSNGGWYMCPTAEAPFTVSSPNGHTGSMTADALGITACLFAFSHLSFGGGDFAELCAVHYHLLREYALDHVEARYILCAID